MLSPGGVSEFTSLSDSKRSLPYVAGSMTTSTILTRLPHHEYVHLELFEEGA